MQDKSYYVYIMMNKWNTVSYVGVTSDLNKRIYEHKNKLTDGFTKKYNIDKLIYFEETVDIMSALEREKQIKRWSRQKKINLIKSINKSFEDLSIKLGI
ncbi:MAG: GIY-YIG nuclease family protein [bacterium]